MFVQAYGLMAASALTANAFMIPSTMSLKGEKSEDLSSSFWGQSPAFDGAIMEIECTGCSWPKADGKDEIKTSLSFDITLSDDSKSVLINGYPFFDGTRTSQEVWVPQIKSDALFEDWQSESQAESVIYRKMSSSPRAFATQVDDESTVELIDLTLDVERLDKEMVHLNPIGIRVLKDEKGYMRLMDIAILPEEEKAPHEFTILPIEGSMDNVESHPHECPTDSSPAALFCQVRSFMKQRLASFRGHPKKKPCSFRKHGGRHHSGPPRVKGGPAKFRHHFLSASEIEPEYDPHNPHGHHGHAGPHHKHHGHHGHHARRFCLRKALQNVRHVLVGFVMPVVAAFFIGTLGGMLFLFVLWTFMRLLGFRPQPNSREAVNEEEDATDGEDEKFGLLSSLENQTISKATELESPPAYVEKGSQ